MKKKIRNLINNQKGNIVVTVGIFMVILLGAAALTIDAGRIFSVKSSFQKALDAAVLSGAEELKITSGDEAESVRVAKSFAKKNYSLHDSDIKEISTTKTTVKISAEIPVEMTFAKVLGFEGVTIPASAKAQVTKFQPGRGIMPLAIEVAKIPGASDLKCDNPGENHGNCGFLDLGKKGGGSKEIETAILNGGDFLIGETVITKPGEMGKKEEDAFQELMTRNDTKESCRVMEDAAESCERWIYIVVIKSWKDINGSDTAEVIGFAKYWLVDVPEGEKRIIGQFIQQFSVGDLVGTGHDYILYNVRLVE